MNRHLLKEMWSPNLKWNIWDFHQFEVLPVPLVMCINGDPQWWGSLVTIWNKPLQNLLSFSLSSHGLDVLTRWVSSKHCNEALQQNVSLSVNWFHWILNDFISPIEHDLLRIHWFTEHELLNYTHILYEWTYIKSSFI
jgi:hypothetical protein